ncbi:proteic killer suppression protein [Tissierella praeacuta DSM 18095]|uniref:Proteic killer suppression protein n=1 Tax=Tissierella praeacuta DSM 18095 TaxID=1123404 RepID=A0A1M4Z275_9FIRM|nr:hypothetical protein [Tissierella praeacuta]SHF12141.1 proteic killer suppression protein [Tissierella praeacuta DSM 18095]SUP00619.1 Uncharacterised protein [Tissierella praeacuta]
MIVVIKNKKLEKIINDRNKLIRKYGPENAKLIIRRLNELKAADSLGIIVEYRIGRCHSLSGDLNGKYALDLDHPDRLIIKPVFEANTDFSKLDLYEVKEVIIEEVKDYHD